LRVLIVGGPGRGEALAASLVAEGHAVRVAGDEARRAAVESAGAQLWIGEPDVIGTLWRALDAVTVLLWALADDDRPDIHGSRLRFMLEKVTDSTVRGVLYETGGTHEESGLAEMRHARETNEIPWTTVDGGAEDWVAAARGAVTAVLEQPR
jgi:hypothetical protein